MASAQEIREFNVRYHDAAAHDYDAKWAISYEGAGRAQVVGKLEKALGDAPAPRFGRALEIGAGTGYFSLNLLGAGVVEEAVATDISPGMLAALDASAARLRLPVETACCEATELPFAEDSFDLVFGHAVLHHLPDLDGAFAELRRVLRPGGALVFCGEPSSFGHRLAAVPKRAALLAAPVWRRLVGASSGSAAHDGNGAGSNKEGLEWLVDVHAFTPGGLAGHARRAGFEQVRVSGEELTANWFGWTSRTLEASATASEIPLAWMRFAYHGYLGFQALDRALFEPRLPPVLFYNLLLSARAP